jgi:hypothetical protein
MTQPLKTAGLLSRPVWLIVRPDGEDDQRRALGPITTLEKLKGVAEGVSWASVEADEVEGFAYTVPGDCKEISVDGHEFLDLAGQTFEQQLVQVLWYDYAEGRWNEEKEWNADRWQDVGQLLDEFGIKFPGEGTATPALVEIPTVPAGQPDVKNYVDHQGIPCLYAGCPGKAVGGDTLEPYGGYATQTVYCDTCHREWDDVYRLYDVDLPEDTDDGKEGEDGDPNNPGDERHPEA